jgi:2-polyprenyl-3-methyl-5-hydroxy-6-metoxy-1,4-benzoquinol methylase
MGDTKQSPLTKTGEIEVIERVSPSDLIQQWREAFEIDISDELQGVEQIRRFRCSDTGLEFYFPPEAAGTGQLYESLQKFDWYYMPHKWEHDAAASDIQSGDEVLEVGCGEGEFVEWLREKKKADAQGIELNEGAVAAAQKQSRPVRKEDLFDLAGKHPESYDVVCSFQVLEHILEVRSFIQASLDVLRPGGKLIFGVPNSGGFMGKADNDLLNQPPHHMTRWTAEVFRALPTLFPMKLQRLAFEPLADYHLDWYASIQREQLLSHFPENSVLKSIAFRAVHNLFLPLIRRTGIYRFLRGHTVYACFEKASNR